MPADWLAGIYTQLTGAVAGSSIATAHNFKRDSKTASLIRFITGIWFGTIAPDPVIDWFGWMPTTANKLFLGSAIGLVAYILVQVILATQTREALQNGTKAVISKFSGAKNEP